MDPSQKSPMKTYLKDCRWGRFLLLDGDMISDFVNLYGEWCEAEVELFEKLLDETSTVIEVGSNIGMHAVPLSRICAKGRLYCYEPQRVIHQILGGNLALNNCANVATRQCAVGRDHGWIEIQTSSYDESWNYGSFSIGSGFSEEGLFQGEVATEPVEMVSLDDEVRVHGIGPVHMLKVDAEGYECEVLDGASALINRDQPWMFVEANRAEHFDDILSNVHARGYNAFWFASLRCRPNNHNRSDRVIPGNDLNLLCCPRGVAPPEGLTPALEWAQLESGQIEAH